MVPKDIKFVMLIKELSLSFPMKFGGSIISMKLVTFQHQRPGEMMVLTLLGLVFILGLLSLEDGNLTGKLDTILILMDISIILATNFS